MRYSGSLRFSNSSAIEAPALSASVTRDGTVSELRTLSGNADDDAVRALIHGLSRGRLEPAQYGGDPVAVNYIWVVAHTTVKAVAKVEGVAGS